MVKDGGNQSNAYRNKEDCRVVPPPMTAIFMLSPFVAAMGNKNSRHREERSDLHLFLAPKNADKLLRNAGHTHEGPYFLILSSKALSQNKQGCRMAALFVLPAFYNT